MNKKLFALIALLSALCFFNSCLEDNNDNEVVIDEKWKAYNEQVVRDAANSGYTARNSLTGNGTVYWKESDEISKTIKSTKITRDGTPYITDSVVCRYTGWYLDYDGKKIIFDTTEENEQTGRVSCVGDFPSSALYPYRIVGCSDMLQYMHEGDEIEVCIPYQLAYSTTGNNSIPGYTTLWFNMKLLKIYADNPGEFD